MPEAIQVETAWGNRAQRRARASDEHRLRPRFVSIGEASDYLGVSRSFFYAKLVAKVRTVRIGRRKVVDVGTLEALADALAAESEEAAS
jgi:hypothetical protein